MHFKLTIAAASGCALAACDVPAPADTDLTEDEGTEAAETGFVMTPGTYEMVGADVVYSRTEIKPDGTYVDSANGEEVGRGTWSVSGSTSCFDPEGDGDDQQERCWTNGTPAEDGSFVTTRVDGSESYTVRPAAAE